MIIKCQNIHCGFDITMPDDKIPLKPGKVTCPACTYPNPVSRPGNNNNQLKNDRQENQPETTALEENRFKEEMLSIIDKKISDLRADMLSELRSNTKYIQDNRSVQGESKEIPPGSMISKALICDDSPLIRMQIKDYLSKLGFISDEAKTVDDAITLIKNIQEIDQHYSMILIDKVFHGDEEGGYKILSEIASMPLNVRRKCYVAFVSAQMRTHDASTAFLMGANTVINKKDLPNLPSVLKEEKEQYENLYKVFNLCLHN